MEQKNQVTELDKTMELVNFFVISFALVAFFIIILFSMNYNQPQSVERCEVEATITNVRHDFGVHTQYVHTPPKYTVYFEYGETKGEWKTTQQNYEYYKNRIGEKISCFLITKTYSKGQTKKELKVIGDEE